MSIREFTRRGAVSTDLPKLDRIDLHILELLQENGSLSNLELADKVGLSPSPCSRRVKALEDSGLIEGYRAHLNAGLLGLDLLALISISMDRHTPERFENFERQVAACAEVLECYLITGQAADYVLKIIVRDMNAFQQFLLGTLTRIEGVTGVHSSFVMRKVIDRSSLPLKQR
ncbi:MAG: AsnC family transcriptional regulator [Oceanospirillaceae bacterium]|nr:MULTISPECIES: Lrp/AsnC family transcriptional regulator [unclassified Thalassolituus]MAK89688.1 AsnC family transcriptional regulator [Thalassolituus sp.]MAX98283.1 AsnC family transcriptional regulator [Oceanospirillaceae bacterium]MBL34528.1 AsnC family transcriptional regulator [Oceanospirillaceae bacterium]MBS54199.1 AsnC family transcriptional regulator [Oceanospirillaceae bacterium]|tara:strand:- start:638 stop:1156 length:519 start_codon:yes stop_codon:yes gene_type:complete